jgi:hypothetical protein
MLSIRDIYPKWGQLFYLTFTHTPFESSQYGILSSVSGIFYFPGFIKHQNLVLYNGFQYRETNGRKYYYPVNRISLPRGYSFVMTEPLAKMIMKYSLNYSMPLLYPDLSIGSIAYLKRIRTNAFYDYSSGYDIPNLVENQPSNSSENYYSFGIELITDFPFSIGIRFSYLPQFDKTCPEFLFSIDTGVF